MLCVKCGEEIGKNKNCPFCGSSQNFDVQNINKELKKETRICKNCQMEISKKANICPFCRSQQPTNKNIIGILLLIICIPIMFVSMWNLLDSSSSIEKDGKTCYATMEKFNKIETGMTYEEVVNIIGCEGTLDGESSYGEANLKIYHWYASNGIYNMNITVSDGKVSAKAQIGLDK